MGLMRCSAQANSWRAEDKISVCIPVVGQVINNSFLKKLIIEIPEIHLLLKAHNKKNLFPG